MAAAIGPDGALIATGARGSESRLLAIALVSDDRRLFELDGRARGVNSVAFSPDGRLPALTVDFT